MTSKLIKIQRLRKGFVARFTKRHPLRFHMSLIVLATVGAGVLATKGLHLIHVENVAIRYPLSVLIAYVAFFLIIKLWLKYTSYTLRSATGNDLSPDISDILPDVPSGDMAVINSDGHLSDGFAGFRGGDSGGGGASRCFEDTASLSSGNGIGDTIADGAGSVVSGVDDEAGIAVLVIIALFVLILAVIFGTGLYLIYEAPLILSETAFEFILAASLLRGTRSLEQAGWIGSVLERTWIPFALTVLFTFVAGFFIHHYFPDVTSIPELYRRLTVS